MISPDQVEAAKELRKVLRPWLSSDDALEGLRTRFPDFDLISCVLKATTLNALYATNVFAIWRMAEHICEVMGTTPPHSGPSLVEAIGKFEGRYHMSFASKFVHFFIESDLPIYDSYAALALARGTKSRKVWLSDYAEFLDRFEVATQHLRPVFSVKEIDQFLWLSGMHRWFVERGAAFLSRDVKELFQSNDPSVLNLLSRLISDS